MLWTERIIYKISQFNSESQYPNRAYLSAYIPPLMFTNSLKCPNKSKLINSKGMTVDLKFSEKIFFAKAVLPNDHEMFFYTYRSISIHASV